VSHFANEEDRRYYLEEDPAHLAFVKSLEGILEHIRVVDYEPGAF
jgi:Stress responsive A/B Barrel Domain